MALAIEPRLKEPISRRVPDIVTKRDSQTVDMPVSVVKIASGGRVRSTARGERLGPDPLLGVVELLARTRPTSPLVVVGVGRARCWRALPALVRARRRVQMRAVGLRRDERQQRGQRRRGVADQRRASTGVRRPMCSAARVDLDRPSCRSGTTRGTGSRCRPSAAGRSRRTPAARPGCRSARSGRPGTGCRARALPWP